MQGARVVGGLVSLDITPHELAYHLCGRLVLRVAGLEKPVAQDPVDAYSKPRVLAHALSVPNGYTWVLAQSSGISKNLVSSFSIKFIADAGRGVRP